MFHLPGPFYTVRMPTKVILTNPHLVWHLAATLCTSELPYNTARIRTCSVLCSVMMIEISSQIERNCWRAYLIDEATFVHAVDVIFIILSVVSHGVCSPRATLHILRFWFRAEIARYASHKPIISRSERKPALSLLPNNLSAALCS